VLPWLLAAGLFVVLELLALARVRSLDGTLDLAGYTQAAWLIAEGREPVMTVTTGAHVLAQQFALLFYPVAWAAELLPRQATLITVNSVALALGVVPLWKICRRIANLRVGAAATLTYAYAVYSTLHVLNLAGFYPEAVALPGMLAAAYFGLQQRWWPYAVCVAVVLAARADLGLAVAGLGGLLLTQGDRRAGRITVVAGLGWLALTSLVLQPAVGDGRYAHLDAFAAYGDSPGSVLWGMLTDPLTVLGDVFAQENWTLFVVLMAPVFFLPILAPRYLLWVLPLQFVYLVADVPQEARFGRQTVAVAAFVFLASAVALSRIGRMGVERVLVDRRVLGALLLAASVFFVADSPTSPYEQPWGWGGRDAADGARLEALELVGPDRSVRASASTVNLLAERDELYELEPTERPEPQIAVSGVDAVVLDLRDVPGWTAVQQAVFRNSLESLGFDQVQDAEGIQVYVRRGT
jgi:uncharacterized membrane protein